MLLITSGLLLILHPLLDGETVMVIGVAVSYALLVVNVFAGLLPVRAAIRRTQADARRRLEANS